MATTKKITKKLILDTLEHCNRLDDDNFPNPDCLNCPMREECRSYFHTIPYEILDPMLRLLKGEDID